MDRFYGTKCEKFCAKTCKDDTCDQTSGECADCSSTPVGPLCRDIGILLYLISIKLAMTTMELTSEIAFAKCYH